MTKIKTSARRAVEFAVTDLKFKLPFIMDTEETIVLDSQLFKKRIELLRNFWKSDNQLKDVEAIGFIVGSDEASTYNKTSAFQEWLFGYDLHDTFCAIYREKMIIITGKKKAEFLQPLKSIVHDVEILIRTREDTFGQKFKTIFSNEDLQSFCLGIFSKDRFSGAFAESWYDYLADSEFKKHDVTVSFAQLFCVKDEKEIELSKQAAAVCSDLYTNFAKSKILDIIDDEKSVKHSKFSASIENALDDKKYLQPGMSLEEIEVCFPPVIQSGGRYSLKFSSSSTDGNIEFDSIVTLLGARYKYYCTALVRTLMVKPSEELKDLYSFVLTLDETLRTLLRPGAKFCDCYNKIHQMVKATYPKFVDNFVRSVGFVTGLEFRESQMVIDVKNTTVVREGMIFCTLIGFQNVKVAGAKSAAVAVGETLLVQSATTEPITRSKKKLGSCVVLLSDNADSVSIPNDVINNSSKVLPHKTRHPQVEIAINDDQRKSHQAELRKRLNEEARRRLLDHDETVLKKRDSLQNDFGCSYKSPSSIPQENDVINLKIFVDRRSDSIILPMFGMSVPFHISTIKNASNNIEGDYTYLRINFNVLIGSGGKNEDLSIAYGKNVYVKEMVFRCLNSKGGQTTQDSQRSSNLTSVCNMIKDMQKSFKSRMQERVEMQGVVKQDDLIVSTTKVVPRLKELVMRPQLSNKRLLGVLEAHTNGFRYISSKADYVDIVYNNIRHAFFQPCDGEVVITLHFHLKSPIIIGKKKYKDIQFYTEIGEIVSDLGKSMSSMLDRDEIEAEDNERETRNKLKMIFKSFVERVESMTNNEVEFEVPFRELGFEGVPNKASCLLVPTTHCLINIIDQPAFIVCLEEIELVHFERVIFSMKHFDMVIVFKDYRRKVCNISSIPSSSLEPVKDWLNSCDIKYTESTQSLNWPKIMKTILDDPEEFFSTGGWSFLDPESDEADGEGVKDDEDEEYKPDSSDDQDMEQDSEPSSDENYESENSEETASSVSEESESGKSWSELEDEARAHDAITLRQHPDFSPSHKRKLPSKPQATKRRSANYR